LQDSDYFSHKFNKADINYELGISLITTQRLMDEWSIQSWKMWHANIPWGRTKQSFKKSSKESNWNGTYREN
jgi:hypothetical protein|tara:strand:+ start:404 stop:619 length:216 start_codon:yes stop_codon:yes gene_type:complete